MIQNRYLPFVWCAAFICSLFFVNAWQLELFAGAVLLIFGWAAVNISQESDLSVPRAPVLGVMAGFLLLAFISILHSDIVNVSFMAFCFFSVMPVTFLVFSIRGDAAEFEKIIKILAVIFGALAVWALLQVSVLSEYFPGQARHPLKNPNSLAALLSLGFFCSVGWMMGAVKKRHSQIALALSLLIFAGMMATGGRGALFAVIPMMGVMIFLLRGSVKGRGKSLGFLALGCLALFFVLSLWMENKGLAMRMAQTGAFDNLNDFSSNRLSLWAATVEMIKAYGVWGTGIGTYFLYFPEFRLSDDPFGAFYAHNDPMQYWVEMGIAAPILFYTFVGAVIWRTARALKQAKDMPGRVMIVAPFCALGACIIHTHVTFNLYNLSILLAVGFLLAAWFAATQRVLKTRVKKITLLKGDGRSLRTGLVALPFIFIGVFLLAFITSEIYTNKARDHLLAGELEAFVDDVLWANEVSLQGNYRSYLLAVNVPLTLLQEAGDEFPEDKKKDIFDQGLSYLRHVRRINPRSSSALYYLGKIQQVAPKEFIPEDLKTPAEYYAAALQLDPLHLGSRMELAKINPQRELEILEGGLQYRYNTSKAMEYYGRLMQIYLQNGDAAARDEMLEKMKNFGARLNHDLRKRDKTITKALWGE